MEVEKDAKLEDQESSEYQQPQIPMVNSWIDDDDDIKPIKLERR